LGVEEGERRAAKEALKAIRQIEDTFVVRTSALKSSARESKMRRAALKIAIELDERAGVEKWKLPKEEELGDEEKVESPGLFELVDYLREVHLYCFFCAALFVSQDEMSSLCPGLTEQDH
jgi:hypothetical protein